MAPSPPAPTRVIHNTIRQTVVHLHQASCQNVVNRTAVTYSAPSGLRLTVVRPAPARPGEEDDPSRPARAARRLGRLLSTGAAQRVLRPFFRDVLRTVLREERERWYSRPRQTLRILWSLLGWRYGRGEAQLRYALHERGVAEGLCRLPAAGQVPPAREAPPRTEGADGGQRPPEPLGRLRLSEGEFRALVRDVSAALGRQARLETLRKGGW